MVRPELLSVVIPCYGSAAYLAQTVAELVSELTGWCPFEIILVNDASPDDLQPVLEQLAHRDPRLRFLELGSNRGQHFATLRGFAMTRGDCVVTVDDDGQNPPSAVKAVAELLVTADLDVAYGSFRTVAQGPGRRLASAMNRWMTRHTLGNTRGIRLTNVRAIRGRLARIISTSSNSTPYIDALLWRSTGRISEVDIEHRARSTGSSTYTLWKLVRLWLSHLTLLTILPLRIASVGSLVVSLLAFLVGVEQMVRVLLERQAPPGWLSLFLATTFLFSTLFLFLAFISTYVGRVYVELNARGMDWVRSSSDHAREGDHQGSTQR